MENQLRYRCVLSVVSCLIALFAVQPCMALVISEVMYNPAGGGSDLEFIELYNDRAVFEDVGGYSFTNGIDYTFPQGTIIGAKKYVVVARDPAAVEAAYGISGVYGPWSGKLDNGGERVDFSNFSGEILISIRYNDRHPWPVSADGAGHSLILIKLAGDPEEASTWAASTFIGGTPGAADAVQGQSEDPTLVTLVDVGQPGRYFKGTQEPSPDQQEQATTAWTEIGFNDNPQTTDWIDGPTGYGFSNEADELQWIRTELNDMRSNYVSVYARIPFTLTAEQISSFSQLVAEIHYDDACVLYLNGVRVADAGILSGDPPAFDRRASSGSDPPAVNVDLTDRIGLLVAGTNILAIQAHNSTPTSSDCMGSPILRGVETQSASSVAPDARLLINEVLANSDAAPGVDWIEIYNPGPVAVDLSTAYLSDDSDDLLKFKIPNGVTLQPGQFWSVRQGTPPDGFTFGLDFSGESIYVTAATNDPVPVPVRVMDAVHYGDAEPDVTLGRFPDGSSSFEILSSATFNAANAQPWACDIVINEIMYHHATSDERYEYIELYNRGNSTISLEGWAFTDGLDYVFGSGVQLAPDSYLVVAEDPNTLASTYGNLTIGVNLFGPYTGGLDNHKERIRLSYPLVQINPDTSQPETYMVTADEVTYYDGGRWPQWADGQGASMELRDPRSNNNAPDAWADSDESSKTTWTKFSFTITSGAYSQYTHDTVTIFDMLLLNRGEVLLDDLECTINGSNRLSNSGFESGESDWRILGNHVQSFVSTEDKHSGSRSLHLISTGHGDPGANRINQSISGINTNTVTFSGWARWLRGTKFLLMRTSREQSPVQPPRPSYAFQLDMPLNLGTPAAQNTALISNRGPDILNVVHKPVLPGNNEPIVVTALVSDNDNVGSARLYYRSEGSGSFASTIMVDNGSGDDTVAGDGIYTGTIPGASTRTMRAFYIEASDGSVSARFPTMLPASADVPQRTCMVRVGDTTQSTPFATYRVWMSDDVVNTIRSRPNLSNELMDCTFVYRDTEVFYNTGVRFRGSPFLRGGFGRDPRSRYAYRLNFNPEQKYRNREEINMDNTEDSGRGPLQERASYWFYKYMGLQYSNQEYVRLILNGNSYTNYEDVQKVDGDYIDAWFPNDTDGYIHKVDDYFEYSSDGTSHRNLDEGLKSDAQHPPIKETYRWGFEKRSHRENDEWVHMIDFAKAMNTSASGAGYEQSVESVIHPDHFARILAIRHAVGDWDSYGYTRGKNNMFYYAISEGKWYLLPWDIDFTLGSGDSAYTNLFSVDAGEFPEVDRFLSYPKYQRMYLTAFAELVNGPWRTSYGTNDPPTDFDKFLDDAANALSADGGNTSRRNSIKSFVRDRGNYILTQIPSQVFEITTSGGEDFCTSRETITIMGIAPLFVADISVNGDALPTVVSETSAFQVDVPIELGANFLALQGLDRLGNPVSDATDSITVTRVPAVVIDSVSPNVVCNNGVAQFTISGSGFTPGSQTSVSLSSISDEIGFDTLYVQSGEAFDRIEAATLLLDDPESGLRDPLYTVHQWINLYNTGGHGEFTDNEEIFTPPFHRAADNFAVRFTGYISVPSPGVRYFGVSSDEGFSLWIDGQVVGEYAEPRFAATTDVTQNRTDGTMSYDFPTAGIYYMVLDYFENTGSEEIEFFQTDSTGGDRHLINVDSEIVVFRSSSATINATDVTVLDENTVTCQADLNDAEPGTWGMVVTPECGDPARYVSDTGLQVIACGADFSGDSKVNFLDWAMLADMWLELCSQPDWCNGIDLNQNGSVDIADVEAFAESWLSGGQ